jgi:hypothetical protein
MPKLDEDPVVWSSAAATPKRQAIRKQGINDRYAHLSQQAPIALIGGNESGLGLGGEEIDLRKGRKLLDDPLQPQIT